MLIAVTGAHGYVGSRVAAAIDRAGADVLRFGRADLPLERSVAPSLFRHVDAVVQAAWDFHARSEADIRRVNVCGSIRTLDAARAAGVERVVFVSTLSAFPGCHSLYGRAKLAIEEHVASIGGIVVRPGLVWGDPGGSLYARLKWIAERAPIAPVFTGELQKIRLAHEDDLARLVMSLVMNDDPPGRTTAAAAAEPLSLAAILRRIARAGGRELRVVRVPWRAAWAGLRALELAGIRPPFRSDSVLSLVGLEGDPFAPAGPPPDFRPFRP